MGSNDDAVAFVNDRFIPRMNIELISRALGCRRSASDSEELFPVRATLLQQIDACAFLLAAGG